MFTFLIPFLLVFVVMIAVKVAAKIRQRRLNAALAEAEKSIVAKAEEFYSDPELSNVVDLSYARTRQRLGLSLTPEPPDSKN